MPPLNHRTFADGMPGDSAIPAPVVSVRRDKAGSCRGFTLVEAIMACLIFSMCTLGVLQLLVRAYNMSLLTRTRDNARTVLATYADQFQRLQTTEKVGSVYATRWLFYPYGVTGSGLAWGTLSDSNVLTNPLPSAPANFAINLGTTTNPVPATVTRDVKYVEDATGTTVAGLQVKAAGYMLQGTFAITYKVNNKQYTQSMTMTRAVP